MPPEEPGAPAVPPVAQPAQPTPAVAPPVKPKPRPPAEIERDIGAEREALGEALSSLRGQVDATRAKVLSTRTFAIAGSVLAALVALRVRRRRHRRRRT